MRSRPRASKGSLRRRVRGASVPAAFAVLSAVAMLTVVTLPGSEVVTSAAGAASNPPSPMADWGATVATPCDNLDTSGCMLPFPNDYYTVPSTTTVTGRQVYFPPGAFPTAAGAAPPDVTPWEHNDGFSPGSTILVHVPGISLGASGVATISDMGNSLRANSPILLLDATTGQRLPTWTELDVNDHNPATQLLVIHPARNLTEGDRYIVALTDLRTAGGQSIPAPPGFAADVLHTPSATTAPPLGAAYAAHLQSLVDALQRDGKSTDHLYLTWDFTVASRQNLTTPALDMRNQVLGQLGSTAPDFTVTRVLNDPRDKPDLAREISGTFDVPSFLSGPAGQFGTQLLETLNGTPEQSGQTEHAAFDCEIPKSAGASRPGHIGIYGHGLFNASTEVYASAVPQFSNAYDYVFCGTDWYGLSSNSVAIAASVVTNLAEFPSLAGNLLQSLLDAQVLGRLMKDPHGFVSSPAFQDAQHRPLIDRHSDLVYYGNSEGGIMGGAFAAVSTDVRRAVLGVPGMDYAVLLPRSADFSPFLSSLNNAYPSEATQQLGFDLMQMLWDRAEADGYAEQMTGGLPGTPTHQVMLEEAFGDHQVANIATEDEARTITATLGQPALVSGRSNLRQAYWDIGTLRDGSKPSSALTVWDAGVPPPPRSDTPPTKGPDPHDTVPRTLPAFWRQMNTFFNTGEVTNPCGSGPCKAPYP